MLRLPSSVRVFVATAPCDMRRQFDGLAALVRSEMERDPKSGDLYVFRNKRGDLLKAIFVDGQGFCMLAKRLDRGSFRVVLDAAQQMRAQVEVSAAELAQLLSELKLTLQRDQPEIIA
jgi:transposase